jgi:hypothetical protein
MDQIKEENLLKKNLNFENFNNLTNSVSYNYSNKEIISVFFHMNFLKVFREIPEEFKDNPFSEVIRDNPRNNLVTLMPKKQSIQKIINRERSKTLYNQNAKEKKRSKNFEK